MGMLRECLIFMYYIRNLYFVVNSKTYFTKDRVLMIYRSLSVETVSALDLVIKRTAVATLSDWLY